MPLLSDEGFLVDASRWTPDLAEEIARRSGIETLTERHWRVITTCREFAAAQGQGAGVVPFSFAAASIPGPVPDLALAPASDSRVRVSYGEADARGLPVEAYLVEWTTASSFTKSSATWTLEVEAGPWGLADLQGRWSVSVGSFTTHPMGPLAPAHVVQEALGALPNVGATRVTRSATSMTGSAVGIAAALTRSSR